MDEAVGISFHAYVLGEDINLSLLYSELIV